MHGRKIARRALVTTLLALAASIGAGAYLLLDSLPRRGGEAVISRLSAPVRVELDRHAVPRIFAMSRADLYRAEGFVHAQERFFQMDLARRSAAGELSALVGRRALALDRARRVFEFRSRARALLASLAPDARTYLEAYGEGVNAGLADLGTRPPEYLLLGQAPVAWSAEDSLLVVYSLYTMLSNNEDFERGLDAVRALLPRAVFELLTPSSSRFDTPLAALGSDDPTGGYRPAPIPDASVIDVRGTPSVPGDIVQQPLAPAASNQWAIPAGRTRTGRAILANDPHLGLRVPNPFYRIELESDGHAARGLSIPGVPGVVIGATDRIAWGATVSYADQADLVVVETDEADPERYRTPAGTEPFTRTRELIAIAGESPEPIEIVATRWGPLVGTNGRGQPLALRATWLDPDGLDLALLDVPAATTADEGIERLGRWSGPSLNWVVADADGRVAWTVNGPVPERIDFDGAVPESWADGTRGWGGWRVLPRIAATRANALFTANNRSLALDDALKLGRAWRLPARAHRIAVLLEQEATLDERGSLAMQLDTDASAYAFVASIVLEVVPPDDPSPALRAARTRVEAWNGRADLGQAAFTLLDRYYDALLENVLGALLAPVRAADPRFAYRWPLADETLRRILETRPAHLLPGHAPDWRSFLRDVLASALGAEDGDAGPRALEPWGDVNRLAISHPLAAALPGVGRWLRFAEVPQPGSPVSLRVATPRYGAVFRLSVSPAAPEDGILELAGGQSGHFLSPHFDDLLDDWVQGKPTPFLAGPTVAEFVLVPAP